MQLDFEKMRVDRTEQDLGWEDVSMPGTTQDVGQNVAAGLIGQMGSGDAASGALSDAVTSAMFNHLTKEITEGSLSLWPQFLKSARRYFNVTHGYVLRKALWQIVPLTNPKKKSMDGEIGQEKDWTVRMFEGLEVDIEEPDLYIPTMGFVTYVLLCGLLRGLQEQFQPDVLSTTITFAMVVFILEVTVAKAVLFMSGATHTPIFDLAALLGYKYFYLSLELVLGLLLGRGRKPEGVLYKIIILGLMGSCAVALWQSLRRLARMQPTHSAECVSDVHKVLIKVLPAMQIFICWMLLPSWPKRQAVAAVAEAVAAVASETTTVAAAIVAAGANATAAVAAAGNGASA